MKSKLFLTLVTTLGFTLGLSHCAAYPELLIEKPKADIFHESAYVSAEVKPQAQLHNYVVELKWSEQLQSTNGLVLRKFNDKGALVQTLPLQGAGARYVDVAVAENQGFRYELWDSSQLIDQVEIFVPMDLHLSNRDYVLDSDNTRVGRIVMGPDRKIIANGHDIQWKLFSLKAVQGSRIQSFNAPQVVGAGLPSGQLELDIQKLEGPLHVEWKGQEGAPGKRGADAHGRGAKGAQGSHGESSDPHTVGGPDGRDFIPGRCVRHPGNGGQGAPGPTGGRGQTGQRGGDLGEVRVIVHQLFGESLPVVDVAPGPGGLGGAGGNGGRGGEGGDPGEKSRECQSASRGPEGPHGGPGPEGARGEEGAWTETFCFQVEGLTLQGKCSNL